VSRSKVIPDPWELKKSLRIKFHVLDAVQAALNGELDAGVHVNADDAFTVVAGEQRVDADPVPRSIARRRGERLTMPPSRKLS